MKNNNINTMKRGSRYVIGTTLGQAYIQHIMSIYSAYIGTSRKASGKLLRIAAMVCLLFSLGVGNAWGTPTVLFHETFGSNSGSARAWDNTYSVKSGVSAVYSGVSYTVTNAKQSKNTMGNGSTSSALVSGQGLTGVFIVGPLDASGYESLGVTNDFGMSAGSWNTTYSVMKCYYSTNGSTYTNVTRSGSNPSTAVSSNANYVSASYSLPAAAQVSTLYLKFEFYCYQLNKSSTEIGQCYLDNVELTGTVAVSKCATPTFSVSTGTYNANQSVTISCATAGASIYYTTDGTTPTSSSSAYSSAVSITSTKTLKAIAIKAGMTNSDVASATYTLQCATPTFSPTAGTYTGSQSVSISCATGSSTIHYTTDGSTPTGSSPTYSSAITVDCSKTVKAIATKTGWSNSAVGTAAYTIKYSVTWKVNGSAWTPKTTTGKGTDGSAEVVCGSRVSTLPTAPDPENDACGDKFVGWTDATDGAYVHGTSTLFTTAGTAPVASGAQIFYAVFADYDD